MLGEGIWFGSLSCGFALPSSQMTVVLLMMKDMFLHGAAMLLARQWQCQHSLVEGKSRALCSRDIAIMPRSCTATPPCTLTYSRGDMESKH